MGQALPHTATLIADMVMALSLRPQNLSVNEVPPAMEAQMLAEPEIEC